MALTLGDVFKIVNEDIRDNLRGSASAKTAKRLGYIREPGVINLSYSRRGTLHSCPRKFLQREVMEHGLVNESIHTSFGSSWGAAIAELWLTDSVEKATIAALVHWTMDLDTEDEKAQKNFWFLIAGLHNFHRFVYPKFKEDYELAYYNGKPCIELFFYIRIGNRFSYQGHIDIILRNKHTGALLVLELKTSKFDQHEAMWANSEQTLGYSIIVNCIDPTASQYEVRYMIFNPKKRDDLAANFGFTIYDFGKSANSKAEFVTDLMLDVHQVQEYLAHDLFPKRGSACYSYNRPCEFFGTCDLHIKHAAELHERNEKVYESLTIADADIVLDMEDIISQIKDLDIGQDYVIMDPVVPQEAELGNGEDNG